MLCETEVLAVLRAVEEGRVELELINEPGAAGSGPLYQTSDGWRIKVFSENGAWRRIDEVWSPDGDHVDLWDERWKYDYATLRFYQPPEDVMVAIYGLRAPLPAMPTQPREAAVAWYSDIA